MTREKGWTGFRATCGVSLKPLGWSRATKGTWPSSPSRFLTLTRLRTRTHTRESRSFLPYAWFFRETTLMEFARLWREIIEDGRIRRSFFLSYDNLYIRKYFHD